jgi:peptidoglycan/LPS O-acetylase OafA/YrhL
MLIYRKELDGLRALAVIAVIIYHANLKIAGGQIFKGGFFGVDVFFVLSGYLITGIILGKMKQGNFSFLDFYWRRAKRIVPALLVMLLATSGLAYFILLPNDLVTYAKSLQSSLYFGSNYFFYGENRYVADASIYKPLLHTWSLGVEWQFYLIYPVIVWFLNKFCKQYMFGILLGLALFSLQYSSFIVPIDPNMAFYLLPSRFWELILGGLVTFYNRENLNSVIEGSMENFIYKSLPLLGLFFVGHSMFFIGHNVQHPSFITVIPVLGTCLFIMFAHRGEVTNDFFSTKPLVFLGLISYPLYLWHKPVFVFFRFLKHEYFRYEQFLLLLIISLVLAFVSYRFVEIPYLKKKIGKVKLGFLLITGLCIALFSHSAQVENGFPDRFSDVINNSSMISLHSDIQGTNYSGKLVKYCQNRIIDEACEFLGGEVVLLGDSYSYQFEKPLYDYLSTINKGLMTFNFQQCPFVSTDIHFSPIVCSKVNEDRWKRILTFQNKKTFIITAYYNIFNTPLKRVEFKKGSDSNTVASPAEREPVSSTIAWQSFADNINKLIKLGHNVIVIYSIPAAGFNAKKEFFANGLVKKNVFIKNSLYSEKLQNSILDKYLINESIIKVKPTDILCSDEGCIAYNELGSIYHDGYHLSYYGAMRIVNEQLKPILDNLLGPISPQIF